MRIRRTQDQKLSLIDRVVDELSRPDPPLSQAQLARRIGAPTHTTKWAVKEGQRLGKIDPALIIWSKGISINNERNAVVESYRAELESLRAENAKLLAAQGLSARNQSDKLAPHLQQIFRAAGKDLCEQVMQAVWPPSAILTAQEASHEAEAVGASSPS